MLFEIAIYMLDTVINFFGSFLPNYGEFPILLPWGLDNLLIQGVTGFKILSTAFPPFQIVLQAFIIYIGFRIIMQLLKAIPILGKTIR